MEDRGDRELIILLVEDNAADVFLVEEALKERGLTFRLQVLDDGEAAMNLFEKIDEDETTLCPTFLLLDLNLPRIAGDEVLERARRSPRCAGIPAIVLTSSDSPVDRERAMRLGADAFFRKPSGLDEFMKLGELIHKHWEEKNK